MLTDTIIVVTFVLASGVVNGIIWRHAGSVPRAHWHVAGATVVFGGLDWLALWLLPRLGLSFGPPLVPWIGITGVRAAIAGVLGLVLRWMPNPASYLARVSLVSMWVLNVFVFACELEGMYVEPFRLTTTELAVDGPDFLPGRPLRVVQLSDIHVERTTKRERAVLAQVAALEPDIIVLTGDYLNLSYLHDPVAWRDARAFFAHLSAPQGVYAVTDSYVDPDDAMRAVFDGLDITLLYNDLRCLPFEAAELCVVGVQAHRYELEQDRAALKALLAQVPERAYTLLLYHSPDLIEAASAGGVDLQLSGHTHGGQIRVPLYGAIFTSSAYGKRFEMGRYEVGETTLYVSRGLGMEGSVAPRARFLCPPEIVVVEIGPE